MLAKGTKFCQEPPKMSPVGTYLPADLYVLAGVALPGWPRSS